MEMLRRQLLDIRVEQSRERLARVGGVLCALGRIALGGEARVHLAIRASRDCEELQHRQALLLHLQGQLIRERGGRGAGPAAVEKAE